MRHGRRDCRVIKGRTAHLFRSRSKTCGRFCRATNSTPTCSFLRCRSRRVITVASPKFGVTDLRGQLDLLLAEGVTTAIERERNTFDQLAGAATKPIVLFGARKLGQKTLAGLRSVGVEPLCFSDNNAALWDTSISGVKVLSPGEAARRFGADAVFVICIWGRGSADSMSERQKQLINLGCRTVTPFVPLFWKYSAAFLPHNALDLPHYVQEQAEEIDFCFEVLSDDKSREEFVRQLTWRLT